MSGGRPGTPLPRPCSPSLAFRIAAPTQRDPTVHRRRGVGARGRLPWPALEFLWRRLLWA